MLKEHNPKLLLSENNFVRYVLKVHKLEILSVGLEEGCCL